MYVCSEYHWYIANRIQPREAVLSHSYIQSLLVASSVLTILAPPSRSILQLCMHALYLVPYIQELRLASIRKQCKLFIVGIVRSHSNTMLAKF